MSLIWVQLYLDGLKLGERQAGRVVQRYAGVVGIISTIPQRNRDDEVRLIQDQQSAVPKREQQILHIISSRIKHSVSEVLDLPVCDCECVCVCDSDDALT